MLWASVFGDFAELFDCIAACIERVIFFFLGLVILPSCLTLWASVLGDFTELLDCTVHLAQIAPNGRSNPSGML